MKEYKLSGGEALARAVEKRYETVASEYHFEPLIKHKWSKIGFLKKIQSTINLPLPMNP